MGGGLFGDDEQELQMAAQAVRIQEWWNSSTSKSSQLKRRETFRVFGKIVLKLSLLQPSSASAERVFSLLIRLFGKQQVRSLNDYKEGVVMMNYNKRTS